MKFLKVSLLFFAQLSKAQELPEPPKQNPSDISPSKPADNPT
jgi:hypothetical protein